MTPSELRAWCNTAAPGARVVYGHEIAPAATKREARALSDAGLVMLFQRREGEGFVRLAVRRKAPKAAAISTAGVCDVPGCGALLGAKNVSGVCRVHFHDREHCGCNRCVRLRTGPSWDRCHAAGMTAQEAAAARGVSLQAACNWARNTGHRFRGAKA